MGYTCPVCADPQADAEHLANHLAFTAMLGDDDHEAWLEEHAPDWDEADADALAATVTELAEETDYPQVFEDTTDHDHDHDHERSGALFDDDTPAVERGRERAQDLSGLDGEDEEILEEARKMTQQMWDSEDERSESSDTASSAEQSRSRDGDAVSRDDENSRGEFSNHSADHSSGRSPREDGEARPASQEDGSTDETEHATDSETE